jgi:hypothetical protein
MYMSGAVAQTATSLGTSFPVNGTSNTDCYEVMIYAPPNASFIAWEVKDMSSGADTGVNVQSTTANLPSSTTFLQPTFWRSNSTTAAAVELDLIGMWIETDY